MGKIEKIEEIVKIEHIVKIEIVLTKLSKILKICCSLPIFAGNCVYLKSDAAVLWIAQCKPDTKAFFCEYS